jgi:hypothetical protein
VRERPDGLLARYAAACGLDIGQVRAELEARRRRDQAEADRRLRQRIAEDLALGLHGEPVPLGQVLSELLDEIGRRVATEEEVAQ